MTLSDVASAVGKGLFAGLAGTAAMTLSSTLEMTLTGRSPSDTPYKAAGRALGVQARNPEGKARFSQVAHWGYGISWGIARGLIGLTGLRGIAAGAVHFAVVWGASQVILPTLDASDPVTEWNPDQIATDMFHHGVYAGAASAAYDFIDNH